METNVQITRCTTRRKKRHKRKEVDSQVQSFFLEAFVWFEMPCFLDRLSNFPWVFFPTTHPFPALLLSLMIFCVSHTDSCRSAILRRNSLRKAMSILFRSIGSNSTSVFWSVWLRLRQAVISFSSQPFLWKKPSWGCNWQSNNTKQKYDTLRKFHT